MTVDCASRSLLVHAAPGLPSGGGVPLLLALHGYRGSRPQMDHYSRLSQIADRSGIFVAYPNSARTCSNSTAANGLPADDRFLSRAIAYLTHRFCVDPGRVFVFSHLRRESRHFPAGASSGGSGL